MHLRGLLSACCARVADCILRVPFGGSVAARWTVLAGRRQASGRGGLSNRAESALSLRSRTLRADVLSATTLEAAQADGAYYGGWEGGGGG